MSEPATTDGFGIQPPRFRLPSSTGVGAVRLQVADVARSVAFYEGVLGLRVLQRRDAADVVMGAMGTLGPASDAQPLVRLQERRGARPAPRRGVLGLYHFAILLPDRAALGSFFAHAGALGVPLGMADHFVSEALYLSDPDGLGIEVYADRPRAVWRQKARQLHMTTEPLDVNKVLAAGEGRPWSGLPAGTTMGHIHLHVGDLSRAADFYHSALGFDKTVWEYPGALFMSAGGYHHHLGTNTWSSGSPAGEDDARLLSWDLVVPDTRDAASAAESLSAAGYALRAEEPGRWSAADPWGTVLRLVASGDTGD